MLRDIDVVKHAIEALSAKPQGWMSYPQRNALERAVFAIAQGFLSENASISLYSLEESVLSSVRDALSADGQARALRVVESTAAASVLLRAIASTDPYVVVDVAGDLLTGHQAMARRLEHTLRELLDAASAWDKDGS